MLCELQSGNCAPHLETDTLSTDAFYFHKVFTEEYIPRETVEETVFLSAFLQAEELTIHPAHETWGNYTTLPLLYSMCLNDLSGFGWFPALFSYYRQSLHSICD